MTEDDRKEDSLYAQRTSQSEPPPATTMPAIERIFADHHSRILSAAYRLTGSSSDAEDVLQTVFLRLLRHSEPPGPSEDLGPYLHRAAVNAALDLLRSRRRARAVPLEGQHEDTSPDPEPGPEQRHRSREVHGFLRAAVADLSPRAAEVFTLRFIEGYSNKEIAHMLGTSQTAVGVTLHRTRSQLRKELGSLVGETS